MMLEKYLRVGLINKLFWTGLVTVVGIDQVSKFWAEGEGMVTLNRGLSWGWGEQYSGLLLTFGLLILMITLYISLYSLWSKNMLLTGFFFGGGVSNIIDRVLWGGVRDWWQVPLVGVKNNLAALAAIAVL